MPAGLMSVRRRGELQAWLLSIAALGIYYLLIKRSLKSGAALMVLVIFFGMTTPAQAQEPMAICALDLATAGGQAWNCPLGGLRGIVDVEAGTVWYGPDGLLDRGKLRLNLSGGEAVDHNTGNLVREAIALNPDVGGCTLIYDGRRTLIASYCPEGFGDRSGIQFYWRPTFHAGVMVCREDGSCSDPFETVAEIRAQAARSTARVARLNGRVNRLHHRLKRLGRIVNALRRR